MRDESANQAPPDFLFVDYYDDNPQNRSIETQKRAFAQKTHQRKKRIAAVERLKTVTLPLRQRLPLAYKAVAKTSKPSEDNTKDKLESEKDTGAITDLRNLQFMQLTLMKRVLSPGKQLGQGLVDPFQTASVPMTECMDSFFHHLRHFTIYRAYPLDSSRMSVWWWQQALCQPAIQMALLVSAASHQTAMNTLNNAPSQYLQRSIREFLRLRGDTIKTVNTLLRNPDAVAESTILIIGALTAIEALTGNVEGATAHINGLNALIELNGGIETLGHMTLSKLYHADIMFATLTDTIPTMPLTSTWRSEIRQEAMVFYSSSDLLSYIADKPETASQLSILGTSFFKGPWYTGLADSMKTFLRVSQRLIQYYEVAQLQQSIILPTDNDLFLLLEHQLSCARYPAVGVETLLSCSPIAAASCLLNEPLRLTLFIYLNMRIWHFQTLPIMQKMVDALRECLLFSGTATVPALTGIKQAAPEILLWVLFTGGMASQGHEGHSWFVDQTRDLAGDLGLREWGDGREILGRFFYTEQPEEQGGEQLWRQLCLHA